ncbi:uncharacterized protein VNE69_01235 [Vairimorpha necatrix]|uniref:Uncharacterized protein n=1 Tax=Vairimorpha necatrix TaxID=6039 RepID=A0AAX4J8U3_9MICR
MTEKNQEKIEYSNIPFFIKNISEKWDYRSLYDFFVKFGSFKFFKPVFSSDMSFIRFIFLSYKEERSVYYLHEHFNTKNFIIDFSTKKDYESSSFVDTSLKAKCIELKNKIMHQMNKDSQEKSSASLYFTDKNKWNEKVAEIKEIIKKY